MKNKLSNICIALAVLTVCLVACTDNMRARSFGGEATVDVPVGQKLITATWKETDLWYLTRPMKEGETAETFQFYESSTFGVLEGTVTFVEHK